MSTEASDTGTVTFVNGHAESQTTEGEGSGIAGDEREAAVAAVKAALKDEAKKAGESAAKEAKKSDDQDPLRPRESTERDASGKFVKTGKEPGEPGAKTVVAKDDSDDDAVSLKRALTERKTLAAAKATQQAEYQRQAAQLQNFQRQLQAQQAEIERDKARLAQLRKDPIRAIRENGWDPEAFILDIARDGTPEGQAAREARELREQLQEMRDWKAAQEKARTDAEEANRSQRQNQHRATVEQSFVAHALDEASYPHIASFYKGHEASLVAEGDSVADQYRAATEIRDPNTGRLIQAGKEATAKDIAEYLEERHANWYKSRSGTQSSGQTAKQTSAAVVTKGRPTQGSATGRTLSPEDTSERRSLGTSFKDLDGDERLAAAREAVGAAMRRASSEDE